MMQSTGFSLDWRIKIALGFVLLMFSTIGYGQLYLQLEKANSLETRKYHYGDVIIFRTEEYGESWQRGKIIQILPKEQALVFYDRISYLKDITYLKYYRVWPRAIGFTVTSFGAAWLIFGGIIEGGRSIGVLDTQYKFGVDTAIIGGASILSGFLVQKIWATSIKKMNKRNRLRIIDLRL